MKKQTSRSLWPPLLGVLLASVAVPAQGASGAGEIHWSEADAKGVVPKDGITALAAASRRIFLAAGTELMAVDATTRLGTSLGHAAAPILALCADGESVWVGTEHGLARWQQGQLSAITLTAEINRSPVATLARQGNNLFMGTPRGLWQYAPEGQTVTAVAALRGQGVTQVYVAEPYVVVVTGGATVYFYEPARGEASPLNIAFNPLQHPVTSVAFQNDVLWFGTDGGGLIGYQVLRREWFLLDHAVRALIPANITALAESGQYLWVGSFSGLGRYDLGENRWQAMPIAEEPNPSVTALELEGSRLWLALSGQGLRCGDTGIPRVESTVRRRYYGNETATWETRIEGEGELTWKAAYRTAAQPDGWLTDPIKLSGGPQTLTGQMDLSRLPDGYYQIRMTARGSSGPANAETFGLVKETAPILLTFRAGPLRAGRVAIAGEYQPASLDSIVLQPGGVQARLDRRTRLYSAEITLTGEKQIQLMAKDQSGHSRIFRCDVSVKAFPEIKLKASDEVFDSAKDTVQFELSQENLQMPVRWELIIGELGGDPVYRAQGRGSLPALLSWNGRDSQGKPIAAGQALLYWLYVKEESGLQLTTPQRLLWCEADPSTRRPAAARRIGGAILFDSGSAELKPQSFGVFEELRKALRGRPEAMVLIEGHADERPIHKRFPSNQALSEARSQSVLKYLVEHKLVEKDRIVFAGYSSTKPAASNDREPERELNRRVELYLIEH